MQSCIAKKVRFVMENANSNKKNCGLHVGYRSMECLVCSGDKSYCGLVELWKFLLVEKITSKFKQKTCNVCRSRLQTLCKIYFELLSTLHSIPESDFDILVIQFQKYIIVHYCKNAIKYLVNGSILIKAIPFLKNNNTIDFRNLLSTTETIILLYFSNNINNILMYVLTLEIGHQ